MRKYLLVCTVSVTLLQTVLKYVHESLHLSENTVMLKVIMDHLNIILT